MGRIAQTPWGKHNGETQPSERQRERWRERGGKDERSNGGKEGRRKRRREMAIDVERALHWFPVDFQFLQDSEYFISVRFLWVYVNCPFSNCATLSEFLLLVPKRLQTEPHSGHDILRTIPWSSPSLGSRLHLHDGEHLNTKGPAHPYSAGCPVYRLGGPVQTA